MILTAEVRDAAADNCSAYQSEREGVRKLAGTDAELDTLLGLRSAFESGRDSVTNSYGSIGNPVFEARLGKDGAVD